MRNHSRSLKTVALLGAAITATAGLGACTTMPTTSFAGNGFAMEPASVGEGGAISDDEARVAGGDDGLAVQGAGEGRYGDGRYRTAMRGGPPPSSFMALGGPALPPIGFMEFCTRYPAQCGHADGVAPAKVRRGGRDGYYWAAAFEGGPSATSGRPQSASPVGAPAYAFAPHARFDWSLVFQVSSVGSSGARLPAGPAPVMTPELWSVLNEVNRGVNGAIREQSDLTSSGVSDHWDLPLADGRGVGDCEDYALEKRRALIARGMPEADLSLALVVTRWGESHAVLVVRTTSGDYVLDSLTAAVTPWRDLDYRWVERQAPGATGRWVKVG